MEGERSCGTDISHKYGNEWRKSRAGGRREKKEGRRTSDRGRGWREIGEREVKL